jgi:RNA polymerase sigma-70 factor (ECF subfamily)
MAAPLDLDALYDEHFAFVWRSARRLGVPEAAASDVVQDVFLVMHRRVGDYDGRTPVRRWLLGIVTRVVADHRRRYWRKDSRCIPHAVDKNGVETLPSRELTPLENAEQAEALELVTTLLGQLDPDKRELLVLSEFEEMSAPEIAAHLGINLSTVYARLRAARRAFDAAHARHRAARTWRGP